MNKLFKLNKQEQGYSLAGVLIIFIVATVLGMSIVALSVNSMNISNKEHDDQSAFYIAESGITFKLTQVETMVESATTETENYIKGVKSEPPTASNTEYGFHFDPEDNDHISLVFFEILDSKLDFGVKSNYDEFEEIKGHLPEATIHIEDIPGSPGDKSKTYNIVSEGVIGDEIRLVYLPIEVHWYNEPEYALLTEKDINIINGGSVSHNDPNLKGVGGDIGSIDGTIHFDGGSSDKYVDGNIFIQDPDDDSLVKGKEYVYPKPVEVVELEEDTSLPKLPDFIYENQAEYNLKEDIIRNSNSPSTWSINDKDMFNQIQVLGSETLTLNVGDDPVNIFVKDFNVSGNIIINGKGPLNIYVENNISFTAGTINLKTSGNYLKEDSEKVNIFYKAPTNSENDLSFCGSCHLYGSIFGERTNFTLPSGSGIYGNLLTGGSSIEYNGGAQTFGQMILAPNAHIEHKNGDIEGIVIAKSYDLHTGTVKYVDVDLEGPLSLKSIMEDEKNKNNTFMQRPDTNLTKQSVREK